MKEKKIEDMTFEEALQALEDAADSLRSGGLSLEQIVLVYDKSILLYNHCKGILDNAKQKIEIYKPSEGTLEEMEE